MITINKKVTKEEQASIPVEDDSAFRLGKAPCVMFTSYNAGIPNSDCWSECGVCPALNAILITSLVIAFISGFMYSKHSAIAGLTDKKFQNKRATDSVALLIFMLVFLMILGLLNEGILLLIIISFAAGFLFARSKFNYSKETRAYSLKYNSFG